MPWRPADLIKCLCVACLDEGYAGFDVGAASLDDLEVAYTPLAQVLWGTLPP